jgi:DNA-nicking Smr family endonuclease
MAEALRPLLERMTKKSAKLAGRPIRPSVPVAPVAVSAKTLLGDVAPVRGAKRVSPTPPVTTGKSGRERGHFSFFAERPGRSQKGLAFVVTRADEIAGYRLDLGPSGLAVLEAKGFRPAREIDLHGQRMRGFEVRLARALRELHARKIGSVLLIHGKGLHSPRGEGVLLESVLAALTDGAAASFVRAFRTAPGRLGGAGALLVLLDA